MPARRYPQLSLERFGELLVTSGDLDPVYLTLAGARLGRDHLRRWMLAYWACYHAGASSWISERDGHAYWVAMRDMAQNEKPAPPGGRWPRGRERRHYRGAAAVASVNWLAASYPQPEIGVRAVEGARTYAEVLAVTTRWPLFGRWIGFKIADMLERILDVPIAFTDADTFYDSPVRAAHLWTHSQRLTGGVSPLTAAIAHLECHLGHYAAPPTYNRALGPQEWETILCKYGAHITGHYPLGIDTSELRHALGEWDAVSPTARALFDACPTQARSAEFELCS